MGDVCDVVKCGKRRDLKNNTSLCHSTVCVGVRACMRVTFVLIKLCFLPDVSFLSQEAVQNTADWHYYI